MQITAPDRTKGTVAIEARSLVNPKDVPGLAAQLRKRSPRADTGLVVARYLSPSTRDALAEAELSYLDWTGNARVVLSAPGLAVLAPGANRDPFRTSDRPTNSLKGEPAAKVARALVDRLPPWKMRDLADEARTSLGSTARTVDFLDREALITRENGSIADVDWPGILDRWARDYDLVGRRRLASVLAPRGLDAIERALGDSTATYAISGSLAARRIAPYAEARLGIVYTTDIDQLREQLEVREAPSRPNLLLIEPRDELPFIRARIDDGLRFAAPSQIYADLMNGPGRSTEEASALLDWMRAHEPAWRM